MKLYTEQELRKHLYNHDERFFEELTPIELPSDEEIESGMNQRLFTSDKHLQFNSGAKAGFKLGAKWMKEQILNQNK